MKVVGYILSLIGLLREKLVLKSMRSSFMH